MRAINIADEVSVNRKRKADKIQEDRFVSALKWVMGTPQGRTVFHEILRLARADSIVFEVDVRMDAFRQGERSVALGLLREIKAHCKDALRLMEDEADKAMGISVTQSREGIDE